MSGEPTKSDDDTFPADGHVPSLDGRIRARLQAAESRRQEQHAHIRQRMDELDRRSVQFQEVARPLMERVVCPRVKIVAAYFENAALSESTDNAWNHCLCVFQHTARFPATTKLDVALCPDDDVRHLLVVYRLGILPMFFQFDGHDQLAVPLGEAIDEREVGAWIDAKLETFVDTYLKLENADVYQRDNMVRDPVCGMPVNKNWAAAKMEYGGSTYYFCVDECRQKFAANPDRFRTSRT